LITALLLLAAPLPAQELVDIPKLRLFTLGSGEVGGSYFVAANAICDMLNRAEGGTLRCSPEPTTGSLYNLDALRSGQLDFALVQSDWQRNALEGDAAFRADGPITDLRSVMALYPEAITVLAGRDAGITALPDLFGKRVDIGHPASGRHVTVSRLIAATGAGPENFAALLELPTGAAIDELCAGQIDATILIVGHPNAGVGRALDECGATLVSSRGPMLDAAFEASPDFFQAVIPQGTYPTLTSDVLTFAVTATLVTRAGVADDLVHILVADTLSNLPALGVRAPVLAALDPAAMQTRGLTAPLHPGAEAAFAGAVPAR
jgi:TRAP transporter TAXI family solute receptor